MSLVIRSPIYVFRIVILSTLPRASGLSYRPLVRLNKALCWRLGAHHATSITRYTASPAPLDEDANPSLGRFILDIPPSFWAHGKLYLGKRNEVRLIYVLHSALPLNQFFTLPTWYCSSSRFVSIQRSASPLFHSHPLVVSSGVDASCVGSPIPSPRRIYVVLHFHGSFRYRHPSLVPIPYKFFAFVSLSLFLRPLIVLPPYLSRIVRANMPSNWNCYKMAGCDVALPCQCMPTSSTSTTAVR